MTREEAFMWMVQAGAIAYAARNPSDRYAGCQVLNAMRDAARAVSRLPTDISLYEAATILLACNNVSEFSDARKQTRPDWLMNDGSQPHLD